MWPPMACCHKEHLNNQWPFATCYLPYCLYPCLAVRVEILHKGDRIDQGKIIHGIFHEKLSCSLEEKCISKPSPNVSFKNYGKCLTII